MTRFRVVTVISAVLGGVALSMRTAAVLAATIAAIAAAAVTAVPADAQVFDKEHFHDSFVSDVYDCDGTPAVDSGEVDGHLTAVQRGSSPFPYFREHFSGTVVTTNTDTGGTYTNVFVTNSHDHTITDNGDGTITITVNASGSSRYYDQFGNFVLKDPGSVRFAFDLDYNGTPGNPDDDTDVPNSFRIVHASTGNSDFSERDFCADLRQFTTP
jgi:hypothetical protein